ncbi:MAG: aminotransferase class III-fold pyridoxal phosphate-dependent enzyme, partial [Pseudomonadota bacterium]
KPDVMAIAKGIGGGFPLGAVMATEKAAEGMVPGTHGSTFGGNPLAMAVGCAVLEKVLAPSVLEEIQHKAQEFRGTLERLKDRFADVVEEVRGLGLLLGLKMRAPAGDFIDACFAEKLLTVMAGDNVVRLIPPLNVAEVELTEAVERLTRACERVRTC